MMRTPPVLRLLLRIFLFAVIFAACSGDEAEVGDVGFGDTTAADDLGVDEDDVSSDDADASSTGTDVTNETDDTGDQQDASTDPGAVSDVRILSPDDGAVVANPVTFEIEATAVHRVQIEADEWPLSSEPWDPQESTSLTYEFAGTGFEREVVLFGFDEQGEELARHTISITAEAPEPDDPGTPIGTFENTYYYLAEEGAHEGPATDALYDASCEPIATVSASFANAACIEGTALLDDGRVINYYQPCSCGGPCSYCWSVMDPDQFPWGKGSQANPLEPLRSWAVDTSIISYGTILYVEEWDGLELPAVDGLGGETHDGCFRADDVGGAINGHHVDIFAGSRSMWQALEGIFPTWSQFTVYRDSPRCEFLESSP